MHMPPRPDPYAPFDSSSASPPLTFCLLHFTSRILPFAPHSTLNSPLSTLHSPHSPATECTTKTHPPATAQSCPSVPAGPRLPATDVQSAPSPVPPPAPPREAVLHTTPRRP